MDRPSPVERPDPNPGPPAGTIDRRRFLTLAGATVAAAVVADAWRPLDALARGGGRPKPTLQPWSLPESVPVNDAGAVARAALGAAVLAPSVWNTQPWRWEVEGATIRLTLDPHRSLAVLDPDQRSAMMSLGAALENLQIALRAYGLQPTLATFPEDVPGAVATVSWAPAPQGPRDRLLFSAIPERRTNRHDYDGRGIYPQNRATLAAQVTDDLRMHWIEEHDRLKSVAELAADAAETRTRDRHEQRERWGWLRFGDDDARRRGDGVTVEALDYGVVASVFAGSYLDPGSALLRFGAQSAGRKARSSIRSSGAVALITAPRDGRSSWLTAGQAYERIALRATTLGIAQQIIEEPVTSARYRGDLLRAFGAPGEEPLMLIRFGHASRVAASVRHAVPVVASFRAS